MPLRLALFVCASLIFAFGALVISGSASAATPDKLVPLASFVVKDQFTHPRLSPDGKHIAVTVKHDAPGRI